MSPFMDRLKVQQVPSKAYRNDQYASPDLVPMPSSRRTWKSSAYVVYWATGGFAVYK
jgi:cytosine/uracil/thiamine/allantoin permease